MGLLAGIGPSGRGIIDARGYVVGGPPIPLWLGLFVAGICSWREGNRVRAGVRQRARRGASVHRGCAQGCFTTACGDGVRCAPNESRTGC